MSIIQRLIAFFMSIIAFFAGLFGGGERPAGPTPSPTAQTFYDVAYGNEARQTLDLALPVDAAGERGLVLFIHGGAWIAGNKDQYRGALQTAAALGYAAAAINYRYLSDSVHMDLLMADVGTALTKIAAMAGERGVTLKKVLLTGASAGAHMSLLYAYKYADLSPIKPAAVVSNCGPTDLCNPDFIGRNQLGDEAAMLTLMNRLTGIAITQAEYRDHTGQYAAWEARLRAYSPLYHVSGATVPTVLGHGQQDTVVPFENAAALDAALTAAGVPHDFVVFPNSGHGLDADPDASSRMTALLQSYAETYLK